MTDPYSRVIQVQDQPALASCCCWSICYLPAFQFQPSISASLPFKWLLSLSIFVILLPIPDSNFLTYCCYHRAAWVLFKTSLLVLVLFALFCHFISLSKVLCVLHGNIFLLAFLPFPPLHCETTKSISRPPSITVCSLSCDFAILFRFSEGRWSHGQNQNQQIRLYIYAILVWMAKWKMECLCRVSWLHIVPLAVTFISILASQICYLLQWHIHSLELLCICLSVEAEIMKFSSVHLVHYCYYDTAVP